MKRLAIAVLTGAIVLGTYSLVMACDRAKKAEVVRQALETSTVTTLVTVRELPDTPHRVVIAGSACDKSGPAQAVVRTAKVARTLGRAIVTTFEAVVGSLVQAAVEKTAAVV